MAVIELPDEQAAALKARAAGMGLSLEAWFTKITEANTVPAGLDWSRCPAVESVPEKMGGAWVFKNTRMPVSVVFENLEDGMSIDELIALYDGLTREQVQAVLDFAARSLEAPAA